MRQSLASSVAARGTLPWKSFSLVSNRSSSAKASAAAPAKPTRTFPSYSGRIFRASSFITTLPSVTCPSPPMADLPLCRTARILVARTHATELSCLPDAERPGFLDEMSLLAKAIEASFPPRKMNYELLGNQVPHLHWHLFPRPFDDADPLRPVWFALDRAEQDE